MVNFGNPSNDRVTLRSCYSLHKASQKPNHRRNTLPPTTFSTTSISAEEHTNKSASFRSTFRWKPRWKILSHAPTLADLRFSTEIHTSLRGGAYAPPPSGASAAAAEPIHLLHAPRHHWKSPHFSLFLFMIRTGPSQVR